MNDPVVRHYSCKDEELPVICGFALSSFKHDQNVFEAYSPRFKKPYDEQFDKRIADLSEMVAPLSETQEVKRINDIIHQQMSDLTEGADRLGGYLDYMKPELILSEAGFGIKGLREGISKKDVEKVLSSLHTVSTNIKKHKAALTAVGLTEDLSSKFAAAEKAISKNKQDAHAISANRTEIVQANLTQFNDLHTQLKEILKAGKILYQKNDPAKYKEYTFSHLRKGVRKVPLTAAQIAAKAKAAEKRRLKAAKTQP
ncbi:MAG: hypothetical protein WCL21_20025 [Mariniphaga sp.]